MSDEIRFYMGADDNGENSCAHDWEWLTEPDQDVMRCAHCGWHQR